MFDITVTPDQWADYEETNQCYLNTGYFFAAFRNYSGLIPSPINIKLMDGVAYLVKYENVSLDVNSKTPYIFLVEIKDGNHRHCNGLIIDFKKEVAYRIEPEANPIYEELLNGIFKNIVYTLIDSYANANGVSYDPKSIEIRSISTQSDSLVDGTPKTCGETAGYCTAAIIYACAKYIKGEIQDYVKGMDISTLRRISSMIIKNTTLDNYYAVEERGKFMGWGSVGRYPPRPIQYPYRPGPIYSRSYHNYPYRREGMSWGGLLLAGLGGFLLGSIIR